MKKVLIVDDIKGWRDYNSNIVKELFEEVEIETADSAQEAYDILNQCGLIGSKWNLLWKTLF